MSERSLPFLRRRIDAAMGRIPCDGVIRDVRYLDVFSCEWKTGDVAWIDGTIVGLEPGLKAEREFAGRGRALVPGFIDAHVHLESSMMLPGEFQRSVLPRGTTTAICDPHELANVSGVEGIRFFLDSADSMALDLRVMLSSCVPATDFETNGAGHLRAADLLPLRSHRQALGLAEMMNFPGVIHGDPDVLEKLLAFAGDKIDGHCPLLRGRGLSAYAACGITSCHESTALDEAREKLTKGIAVWIREGSVAKDLTALIPILTSASSAAVGFCTDDRNPLDIVQEGHLDHLVRRAVQLGADPALVYRAMSWSVARHYRLDTLGAVAPGYRADLVLLADAPSCSVERVFTAGREVSELPDVRSAVPQRFLGTVKASVPEANLLRGPQGRVHVIVVEPGKILTDREVNLHDAPGIAHLSVLERHGNHRPPANAYVRGFGSQFRGAIGSSVGHDSHNLICVGSDPDEMRIAFAHLIQSGGGFCVVSNGKVIAELPLPVGGLMSQLSAEKVVEALRALRAACRSIGCELEEPFLQLAFLSLPVIPSLKLTDRGLFDVGQFKLVDVSAA